MTTIVRALGLLCAIAGATPMASAQIAPQQSTSSAPAVLIPSAAAKLVQQPHVVVLDVRTPTEYATGHIRGAQNLDFRAPDFAQQIARLDTAKTYLLYCASGNRSGQASKFMQEKGFANVVNAGAFKTLKEGGLKTE